MRVANSSGVLAIGSYKFSRAFTSDSAITSRARFFFEIKEAVLASAAARTPIWWTVFGLVRH
jgi:hypothetical protein